MDHRNPDDEQRTCSVHSSSRGFGERQFPILSSNRVESASQDRYDGLQARADTMVMAIEAEKRFYAANHAMNQAKVGLLNCYSDALLSTTALHSGRSDDAVFVALPLLHTTIDRSIFMHECRMSGVSRSGLLLQRSHLRIEAKEFRGGQGAICHFCVCFPFCSSVRHSFPIPLLKSSLDLLPLSGTPLSAAVALGIHRALLEGGLHTRECETAGSAG